MRGAYQMDDASTAHVVISPEAFLTLKRLKTEFEEVIETIEILKYAPAYETDQAFEKRCKSRQGM
jgi:hypothetical protein